MRNYLLIGGPNHGQIIEQHHDKPEAPIRVIINTTLEFDALQKYRYTNNEFETVMYHPRRIALFNKILRVAVYEDLANQPPQFVDILVMRLIFKNRIVDILEK